MSWKIEIKEKSRLFDAIGQGVKNDILDLGITGVSRVHFSHIYTIEGTLSEDQARKICLELLIDKVTQDYNIHKPGAGLAPKNHLSGQVVEVAYNPGVMDPVEASVLRGIKDLGISAVTAVSTAKKYRIEGALSPQQLQIISEKLLYNKLIQHIVFSGDRGQEAGGRGRTTDDGRRTTVLTVDLLSASDKKLLEVSKAGQLFLNLDEMSAIRKYFRLQKRDPTDCELETIAQTWSEHCNHKTFRGKINYTEKIRNPKHEIRDKSEIQNPKIKIIRINNLLKTTIMKVTKELKKPWCVSVFKDNSGVIEFDDKYNVCFKVETHNHPSALEPFGGANTGVGGVVRDPLGTGLGAKPVLNTDVFCFGPPDLAWEHLPEGVLHPKRVMKGVVSGVRDYGNKMGIPTVNGAVLFHEGFVANPLVYCGTAGIMPKDKSFNQPQKGDLIVVVGGRTGRDGIHGATFSSGELTHESQTVSGGAVQIGNPIQEKKMVDTILAARDKNLFHAITDCGAGGLSSAVGEMGRELGARVDLERVPLKYTGLSYTEIWISESQERMVLAVAPEDEVSLMEVFNCEDVEATVIGEFTSTKRLNLYYFGELVCDLDMEFLHEGIPQIEKKAVFTLPRHKEPAIILKPDLTPVLLKLLGHFDICSKEWVVRQYDHEVQGGSVLKPLVGVSDDGPSDAAVVKPLLGSKKALIIANGINFRYGLIDPYWMAASCIDEALRQVIAVGGSLEVCALLDNFCWGNPDKPDRLGGLVRSAFGCYDIAKAYGVPFISGKDSFYNEYTVGSKSLAIPGTLLISALAVTSDAAKTVSMYAKDPGNLIYIVGKTYDELGGSHYYDLYRAVGNNVPKVYPKQAKRIFNALSLATGQGLVRAMHDCSDGGLCVALAEMAFSGGLGMEVFLGEVPCPREASRDDLLLFSESNSRFIVEVQKKDQKKFEAALKGLPFGLIGCVSQEKSFKIHALEGGVCVEATIDVLKEAWQRPLAW